MQFGSILGHLLKLESLCTPHRVSTLEAFGLGDMLVDVFRVEDGSQVHPLALTAASFF